MWQRPKEKQKMNMKNRIAQIILATSLGLAATLFSGCQVLTYASPTGERFSRVSVGANTSISALTVETTTNGLRRIELHGYQNDSAQALGAVTEAAVRAAIQSAR